MSACQGIIKVEPFARVVEVDDYVHDDSVAVVNGTRRKLVVCPLDNDPTCRLGDSSGFVVGGLLGLMGLGGERWLAGGECVPLAWRAVLNKHNETLKTYATPYTRRDNVMHDRMK